ncbi:MAG: hypothetical protein NC209_00080 [Alistipes sp.]|nr:hypothetical protein [Alistipes senegalensis]MCM1249529.1 hypothetical protein [Alistipes sp.]
MKSPLLYLLETLFCSCLLMSFYRLALHRKISFAWSRRYLVGAVVLAVLIPALRIPVYPSRPGVEKRVPIVRPELTVATLPAQTFRSSAPAQDLPASRSIAWPRLGRSFFIGAYFLVVLFSVGAFVRRIVAIVRLRRSARLTACGAYVLAESPAIETPFSFLRTIYLGDGYEGRRRAIVLCHEASHVRHRHSLERLAVEAVRCVWWFDPFIRAAGRWLAEVHEWEADRDALDSGCDLTEYRSVLFHQLFGYNPDMACGLNHSLTKNRFAMMTRFQKRPYAAWRLGAALPVVAGMMMLCSFTVRMPGPDEQGSAADPEVPVSEVRAKLSASGDSGIRLIGSQFRSDTLTLFIGSDHSVSVDDDPKSLSFSELEKRLTEFRDARSAEERSRLCVCLAAAPRTPLELISAVKEVLRRVSLFRVSYVTEAQRVGRLLPPKPQVAVGGIRVATEVVAVADDAEFPADPGKIAVRRRNLLLVSVDDEGRMMAGPLNRQLAVDAEELTALVGCFITEGADRRPVDFERDGTTVTCPVSEGVVSLAVASNAPYGVYLQVQQSLEEGFRQARVAWAEQQTGIPYAKLSEADRRFFERVVPLKIVEISTLGQPARNG